MELEVRDLTHIYGKSTPFEHVALSGVDFRVTPGEIVGVIGRTGSGKSTLIKHLNGLLKPDSGAVLLDGTDINSGRRVLREARFRVGIVFQYPEYQLFESTVYRDIAFGPLNMGLSDSEVRGRVMESAEFVGLCASDLERSPFELSGGQKRRAAIAGVMAMRPEVLILDEPTAGLDPRGRAEIIDNILNYRREYGATVITVTHSMEDVARYASRVCVLESGKIVLDGTPGFVFSQDKMLLSLGLGLPKAALVAKELRSLGVPLGSGIYTNSGLVAQILKVRSDLRC